jgi:hypothetical protein
MFPAHGRPRLSAPVPQAAGHGEFGRGRDVRVTMCGTDGLSRSDGGVLRILLDVAWPQQRVVRVSLRALPLVRSGTGEGPEERRSARPLFREHVASMSALHSFLAAVTRSAANGETVEVVGFEPDVDTLLDLLDVQGRIPDVIPVTLPAR